MSFESRLANRNASDFGLLFSKLDNLRPYTTGTTSTIELSNYPGTEIALVLADEILYGGVFNGQFMDMTKTGSGDGVPGLLYNKTEPEIEAYCITGDDWLDSIGVGKTRSDLYNMATKKSHSVDFYKAMLTILSNLGWMRTSVGYEIMSCWEGEYTVLPTVVSGDADVQTLVDTAISNAITSWQNTTGRSFTSTRRGASLVVDRWTGQSDMWAAVSAKQIFHTVKFKPASGLVFVNKCHFSIYFTASQLHWDGGIWPSDYESFSDAGVPSSSGTYVLVEGDSHNEYEIPSLSSSSRIASEFPNFVVDDELISGWSAGAGTARCFVKLNLDE